MEKQSKEVTENEAQFIDEIREVRERAKEGLGMKHEAFEARRQREKIIIQKNETYRIDFTFSELEFIRNVIDGLGEFLKCIHGDRLSRKGFTLYNLCGNIKLKDIELELLEQRIYEQYHDPYGEILEPEIEESSRKKEA